MTHFLLQLEAIWIRQWINDTFTYSQVFYTWVYKLGSTSVFTVYSTKWFNFRFRTSNQDTFGRAWDGGCNGTQHMAIRAELLTHSRVERPERKTVMTMMVGHLVIVLDCIFGCFKLRIATSNQDTFWWARDGGCNGTQHIAIGAVHATQSCVVSNIFGLGP